ncbi:MAG: hypothetical protein MUC62_08665 [Candidatus Thermoplasmatota archaeon]|jgi:hypothetical protein|nr:hypothetical protein [Candidatus Thermoplasmatota archaeon]
MLLDIEHSMFLLVPLLVLIGICLIVYGKGVFMHTAFFIGALTGGILAYMVLEGLLGPYGVPLLVKVIITFAIVFLGGLVGQGASAMLIAFLVSLAAMDLISAFVPDDLQWTAYVAGTLMFVLVIIIVQKFLFFFTSLTGGLVVAAGLYPVLSSIDAPIIVTFQILLAVALGVGGYFIQKKIEAYIHGRNEEIVWVPTPPKHASSR